MPRVHGTIDTHYTIIIIIIVIVIIIIIIVIVIVIVIEVRCQDSARVEMSDMGLQWARADFDEDGDPTLQHERREVAARRESGTKDVIVAMEQRHDNTAGGDVEEHGEMLHVHDAQAWAGGDHDDHVSGLAYDLDAPDVLVHIVDQQMPTVVRVGVGHVAATEDQVMGGSVPDVERTSIDAHIEANPSVGVPSEIH